jgi:hypothetical protein
MRDRACPSRLSGGLSWCRRRPDGAGGDRGCNTLRGGGRSVLLERGTVALEGALLARLSSRAEVEVSYREALALVRHQQARSLELRAAISLARLGTCQSTRAHGNCPAPCSTQYLAQLRKEKVINSVTASRFGLTDATRRFLAYQRSLHAGYLPSSKAKAWFGVFP